MSIYSKNHTYLGNADKICRFIGRKYKSQFWPNISSRYISLYLWIYVPHLWIYITQEKWAKNLVDFFLISCQWNRREKWAKNLVDFFQISCGFFSNILWIFPFSPKCNEKDNFHKALPNVKKAYVTLRKFTPDLKIFYTDISAISVTLCNSGGGGPGCIILQARQACLGAHSFWGGTFGWC